MKRKTHPYADLFPMMTAAELDALAQDIKENGLRQPVILCQGAVLDGRNRLLACEKAGVEPAFTEHEGDDASALALVISLNVQRRDLTPGQRAIVAARAMPLFEEAGKQRMLTGKSADGEAGGRGKAKPSAQSGQRFLSREAAATVFKVNKNYVQQAKAVLSDAPDLAEQVAGCTLSLADAYQQVQERLRQTRQKEEDSKRVAKYMDAIKEGEMTFEEALQKVIEEEREEKENAARDEEARGLWFRGLAELVAWVEQWVSKRSDEHLAWYAGPAGQSGEDDITEQRIEAVIQHLERVRTITFGGKRYVPSRSPKARS